MTRKPHYVIRFRIENYLGTACDPCVYADPGMRRWGRRVMIAVAQKEIDDVVKDMNELC
jgi:hypothetical protein